MCKDQIDGGYQFTLFDDAMISMTYARTLAETGEWVWFPGAERVQGFTNLLWTAYMALLHVAEFDASSIAFIISITGIMLIVTSALLAATIVRLATIGSPNSLIASALTAGTIPFLYPLVFWSLRGMEVGFLALLTVLMIMISRKTISAISMHSSTKLLLMLYGLTSVMGILTRLDFSVISFVIIGLSMLWASSSHARYQILLFVLMPTILGIVCLLIFQYIYWGDWMPNTYRLKVEGYTVGQKIGRGLSSLDKAIPFITLVAFSFLMTIRQASKEARYIIAASSSVVLITCLYSVWVGGDAWEWSKGVNRYIAVSLPAGTIGVILAFSNFTPSLTKNQDKLIWPIANSMIFSLLIALIYLYSMSSILPLKYLLPLSSIVVILTFIVVLFLCNSSLLRPTQQIGVTMSSVALLVLITVSAIPGGHWLLANGIHVSDDHGMTSRSRALSELTKKDAVIATVWAGAPAYYSKRKMIDLLGKSDRVIAGTLPKGNLYPGHNKWNYSYSIGELRPDIVFQLWKATDEDVKKLQEWGYVKRCNDKLGAAHYLANSDLINWEYLQECP